MTIGLAIIDMKLKQRSIKNIANLRNSATLVEKSAKKWLVEPVLVYNTKKEINR